MIRRPWNKDFRPSIFTFRNSKYSFRVIFNTIFSHPIYSHKYIVPHTSRNHTNIDTNINTQLLENKITVIIEDDPVGYIANKGCVPSIIVDESMNSENIYNIIKNMQDEIISKRIFFIATPSRRLDIQKSFLINREIGTALREFQIAFNTELRIISKIDSCLRSNYEPEFNGLKDGYGNFTLECLIPAYIEQSRITVLGTQYIVDKDIIPIHETEFSSFKGLEFKHSDLSLWLEERSKHHNRKNIGLISIDDLRLKEVTQLANMVNQRRPIVKAMVFDICDKENLQKVLSILIELEQNTNEKLFYKLGPSMINYIVSLLVKDEKENCLHNISNTDSGILVAGSLSSITKKQIAACKDEHNTSLVTISDDEICDIDKFDVVFQRKSNKIKEYITRNDNVVLITEYWKSERNEYPSIEQRDKVLLLLSKICSEIITTKHRWFLFKGSDTALFVLKNGLGIDKFHYCGQIIPGVIHIIVKISENESKSCFIVGGNVGQESTLVDLIRTLKSE